MQLKTKIEKLEKRAPKKKKQYCVVIKDCHETDRQALNRAINRKEVPSFLLKDPKSYKDVIWYVEIISPFPSK